MHRIGQKADSVKILYLLARESSDSIVWKQIQAKHNVLGATVGMNALLLLHVFLHNVPHNNNDNVFLRNGRY